MDLTLTTPALLFPAISLLLLAYTSRFLTLATLIRSLQREYRETSERKLLEQVQSLQRRVQLIRDMQLLGVLSFFLCVLCMFVLFVGATLFGAVVFGASLLLLMASLALSVREIRISVDALNTQLRDLIGPDESD